MAVDSQKARPGSPQSVFVNMMDKWKFPLWKVVKAFLLVEHCKKNL